MYLDGSSIFSLSKELHTSLAGSRINKVFHPSKHTFIFHLKTPLLNSIFLKISILPQMPYIALVKDLPLNPTEPSAFCMLLRKHLINSKIEKITQLSFDRIITFHLHNRSSNNKITNYELIIELTGKNSNFIFTQENFILECARHITKYQSRHRQILPSLTYTPPPAKNKYNLMSDDLYQIIDSIIAKDCNLLPAITNTCLGIGILNAKEICFLASLAPEQHTSNLNNLDKEALRNAFFSFKKQLNTSYEANLTINSKTFFSSLTFLPLNHITDNNFVKHNFKSFNDAFIFSFSLNNSKFLQQQKLILNFCNEQLIKIDKKNNLLKADFDKYQSYQNYKLYADLLLINIHNIPQIKENILLNNIYSNNNETINIPLSPCKTISENIQNYYRKYSKAKRSLEYITTELEKQLSEKSYLENLLYYIENAVSLNELHELQTELLTTLGFNTPANKQKFLNKKTKEKTLSSSSSFLQLKSPSDILISIGNNNKQNDLLTFKKSSLQDTWLHAKDIPGAHVILHNDGHNFDDHDLFFAAELAAYHSKARNSSNVPVDYTMRKNVKKPSGSKPGFVIYEQQKTLFVNPINHSKQTIY